MKTIIKLLGICALTIFALCINVNGKPIFHPLYSALSHITIPVQNATEAVVANAFHSGQDYSRKLFYNSVPKVRDSVKSRVSAPFRTSAAGEPKEVILVEEKEELDELIKSHH